jgi:hypothetical protein
MVLNFVNLTGGNGNARNCRDFITMSRLSMLCVKRVLVHEMRDRKRKI